MRKLLILSCLLLSQPGLADVYRSVDKEGNIIYSDQPSPDAEKVRIDELQTISPPPPPPPTYTPPPEKPGPAYSRLAIASPENDAALRADEGSVNVAVAVEPSLLGTDTLVVYLDGKEYASGKGTSFVLSEVERGTHQLRAVVKGVDGKIKQSSASSTFHLLSHSSQHPKPTVGTPPKKNP